MTTWTVHLTERAVDVADGPALLSGLAGGPSLAAHEDRYGPLPELRARDLVALTEGIDVRGRGGAGFPFARKVATVAAGRSRPVVVVNLSEGEPASLKDGILALVAPHLVLDGAAVAARALGARRVHLVLPGESPELGLALRRALEERRGRGRSAGRDRGLAWTLHDADDSFVAGQSSAVLELLGGRPNLPVTSWQPAAVSGHRRRPTLLSNAETFAHVARLALLGLGETRRHGTPAEPGTTLLTIDGDRPWPQGSATVVEAAFGTPWRDVVPSHRLAAPVLLGGYHGTWATPGALEHLSVSRTTLGQHGLSLGAGIVLPLDEGCPVDRTSRIVTYLAGQSARRCGPCLNGLPALAATLDSVRRGAGGPRGVAEVERISGLVDGRGACAHPDGTARLVRSLLHAYGGELALHAQGGCGYGDSPSTRAEVSA